MKTIRTALLLAAALAASGAFADGILDARIFTVPERPYVGQTFQVRMDIAVAPGCELGDAVISGIPLNFRMAPQGPREQSTDSSGKRFEWHRFSGQARSMSPIDQDISCTIVATVTRRTSQGIFSRVFSTRDGVRLQPFRFTVRDVPAEGQPEGYSGAIGDFSVRATVEPANAAVGDLLTVTMTVEGTGDLNGASPVPPALGGSDVKVYPPQEISRTEGSVVLRQIAIPLSTNVVSLGAASFPFFDPKTGEYHVATSQPLSVEIAEKGVEATAPMVKTIPAPVPTRSDGAGDRAVANVVETASDMRKVMPFAIAAALALVAAAVTGSRRAAIRVAVAAAVFAASLAAGLRFSSRSPSPTLTLGEAKELRIAPSEAAASLGWIGQGTEVKVLETYGGWTRIGAGTQSGWIAGE